MGNTDTSLAKKERRLHDSIINDEDLDDIIDPETGLAKVEYGTIRTSSSPGKLIVSTRDTPIMESMDERPSVDTFVAMLSFPSEGLSMKRGVYEVTVSGMTVRDINNLLLQAMQLYAPSDECGDIHPKGLSPDSVFSLVAPFVFRYGDTTVNVESPSTYQFISLLALKVADPEWINGIHFREGKDVVKGEYIVGLVIDHEIILMDRYGNKSKSIGIDKIAITALEEIFEKK